MIFFNGYPACVEEVTQLYTDVALIPSQNQGQGKMKMNKALLTFALTGVLAVVAYVGCSKKDDAGSGLSGKIDIDGSSTVYPISEAIAADFKEVQPGVNVTVGVSGTGGGFKRFVKGETDISDASRPIKPEELAAAKENKVEFIELPVAYDGLTIAVHKDNKFIDQLTVDDLKKIFLESSAPKTWKEVNQNWPATEIKIFAPGTDSGTFDYFKEVVAGKEGAIRSDISPSEDDNVLVTGVAGDENAIGFFGASYYFENKDKLKAVPIVNPDGKAVSPTAETIESGEYAPFSRPLFIYVNVEAVKRPEVKKFVEYYLEKAPEAAVKVKYVALPKEIYERGQKHYDDRLTGTHYLDAEGNKRKGALTEVYKQENLPASK